MMIEIRHLKSLQALRETGSLVEASERLHVTQSALSHQLKDLEDKLNTQIFIRKTRPLRFTQSGLRLLRLADEVLPLLERATTELSQISDGYAGRLNIAIECHTCFQWLMPTLNRYRELWPDVEVDLSAGFHFEPLSALQRGDIDLVITADPQPIADIDYTPLFQFENLLALPKQHRLNQKVYIEPQDLEQETIITYPVEQNRLALFKQFLQPAQIQPQKIRTADLTLMIIQLVSSGRGVTSMPNWGLTEYLDKDFIDAKPIGAHGLWSHLYAATRAEQTHKAFIQAFINTSIDTCFNTLSNIQPIKL